MSTLPEMKTPFTILFLFLYLLLTAGVNILIHTCGGESDAMIAASSVEDPCGCGNEDPADRCCTTEVTTVKIDDAQKTSMSTMTEQLSVVEIHPFHTAGINTQLSHKNIIPLLNGFSPPSRIDRTVLNSVFLI